MTFAFDGTVEFSIFVKEGTDVVFGVVDVVFGVVDVEFGVVDVELGVVDVELGVVDVEFGVGVGVVIKFILSLGTLSVYMMPVLTLSLTA